MRSWRKPQLQTVSVEEMTKIINARAKSATSCQSCSGCSCSASCNPLLFYWSCTANFFNLPPIIGGGGDDDDDGEE